MKKTYSAKNLDICLIATSEVTLGVRSLSAYMKGKEYTVAMGLFAKWGLYSSEELAGIKAWITDINPAIIGISSIEFSRERTLQLMSVIKTMGKTIVAGGPDPTADPDSYLGAADYVVRGEGELAFADLVGALCSGQEIGAMQNVCYRRNDGHVQMNPVRPLIQNLDGLPFEDWLDIEHHYMLKDGAVSRKQIYAIPNLTYHLRNYSSMNVFLLTMRGCIFECSFCVNSLVKQMYPHETMIRKRSVASVIDRAAQILREGTTIDMFWFQEDDFFLRTDREIAEFAAAWKEKIRVPFCVHCSPSTVTEKKLVTLIDAGLAFVEAGIQTGSDRTNVEIYDRNMGTEAVLRMAALLHKHIGEGSSRFLQPIYDFIMNNPYETEDDILATIELFRKLPKPYYANLLSLKFFQGTKLYEKAVHDGLVKGKDAATKYDCHDTINNSALLIQRGGHYYLNSLLYWCKGFHTRWMYAFIPGLFLGALTNRKVIGYFSRKKRLVDLLNDIRPGIMNFVNTRMTVIMRFMLGLSARKSG